MPVIGSGAFRNLQRYRCGCQYRTEARPCCYFHLDFCCPGIESDSDDGMQVDGSILADSSSSKGVVLGSGNNREKKRTMKKGLYSSVPTSDAEAETVVDIESDTMTPLVEPTLMECGLCTPTVHTRVEGRLVYDARVMLVLIVLSNSEWDGEWAPGLPEMEALYRDIQQFHTPRKTTSLKSRDHVCLDWILDFVAHNREQILSMPPSLHGILNRGIVADAFEMFDKDGNNVLDLTEWENFLSTLEVLHWQHVLQLAHQKFRAFYGRGQAGWFSAETRTIVADQFRTVTSNVQVPFPTFQWGYDQDSVKIDGKPAFLPPGWLHDFYYYSANNHPLHGIFACDPSHRLSRHDRITMELAVIAFTFLTNGLQHQWVMHGQAPCEALRHRAVFGLVVVTLPSMIMFWTLFLLFTCPWGNPDRSRATPQELKAARRITAACELLGNALVVICFVGLGYRLLRVEMTSFSHLHLRSSLTGRLRSYIISWVMMICVYFNPFAMWANPNPGGTFCLGDYIGLGQWRAEKQRFQAICKAIAAKQKS